MKSNRKNNPKEQIKAILGEGTNFNGSLKYDGTVRIDGFFEGDIVTGDKLIIGGTGVFKGTIEAGIVHVFGSVIGEIRANSIVQIMSKAQIIGDIISPVLIVEEGVKLLGNCTIGQDAIREYKRKLLPANKTSKQNEIPDPV